jgi:hypothetical protein
MAWRNWTCLQEHSKRTFLLDLWFSQQWMWTVLSSGMWHRVVMSTDVSGKRTTPIFTVKTKSRKEPESFIYSFLNDSFLLRLRSRGNEELLEASFSVWFVSYHRKVGDLFFMEESFQNSLFKFRVPHRLAVVCFNLHTVGFFLEIYQYFSYLKSSGNSVLDCFLVLLYICPFTSSFVVSSHSPISWGNQ